MVLAQSTIVQSGLTPALLPFNMRNIDSLFSGFVAGDFAVIYGLPHVLTLLLLLAVRAQLPFQLGGLESGVVFVDGGNTFRLYKVSRLARLHHLRPRDVLRRIFVSRAFTMHQMTSIILDGLEEATRKYDAKLVVISDFQGLYLDKDIPPEESKEVFIQVAAYISEFSRKTGTIVLAACLPHYYSRRNAFLQSVACARSNVTISITRKPSYPFGKQFALGKHPSFKLGCVDFPSENLTLNDFVRGGQ